MPDDVGLSPLERVRLALVEVEESRRVIVCRPELEAAVRAAVAELCVREDLIEVQVSPYLPDGTACIWFDPNVIEAGARQSLQRGAHEAWAEFRAQNRLERELRWMAIYALPDPRSAVIITGI